MPLNSRYRRRLIARLAAQQEGRCCYCKRTFTDAGDTAPTIEHKKARMDGGRDHVSNFAVACLHCNRHRGRQMVRDRLAARAAKAKPAEVSN